MAKEYLEKLDKNTEIAAADRTRLLAQYYELIQDGAKAQETWKTLESQTQDTPAEQTTLAQQLAKSDLQAAEKALRRALQLDAKYYAARFMLADLLANRGGKENLAQAREIAENLSADPQRPRGEEVLLLAKIYELEGKVEDAKSRLQPLVEASPTPPYVAAYAKLLLRQEPPQDDESLQKLLDEREHWVKKLQSLAPADPQSIALMAQWLKQCGRQPEIEPTIEAWAAKQRALVPKNLQMESIFLESVGNLYLSLESYSARGAMVSQGAGKCDQPPAGRTQ